MVINNNSTTERNRYLDLVKSFAIICVIIGHCIQYGSGKDYLGNGVFFDNPLFKFIYSFHMPLFMLISGYLFAFSVEKRTCGENFRKKITTLLVPILSWSFVSFILTVPRDIYNTGGVKTCTEYMHWYVGTVIYSLWFLWAILYASIIVLVVKKYFRDSCITYIILIFISLFLPNKYNIGLYSFMLPYYIIGYKFNIHQRNGHKALFHFNYNRKISTVAIGVVFFILLYFYNYDAYIYTSGYCILNESLCFHLITNIYRFTIGLIGSCFVLSVIKNSINNITDNAITRGLTTIGKETMGLYIISGFCFSYILPRITYSFNGINYGMLIIETISVLLVSHIIVKIIMKNHFTNKVFLGSR